MKVVQINVTSDFGSTGVIVSELSETMTSKGIENYIFCVMSSAKKDNVFKYSKEFPIHLNALKSRIFGNYGFNSDIMTKRVIKRLQEINPDVIHIHNIHGHNINVETVLEYIKANNIKLVWTFHDCWAFTGYCTHFVTTNCQKWQNKCFDCDQRKTYSFFFDNSTELQRKKIDLIKSIKDKVIVCPSKWMADIVKSSPLFDVDIKVINNGIDLNIFKPTESNIKEKYPDKKIILTTDKNNLEYVSKLSKLLDDNYVLLFLTKNKNAYKYLSDNSLVIPFVKNRTELAKLYTAADVFVNLTMADTFPTVNMEALACGTPIITFDTGGSPEMIDDSTGITVPQGDVNAVHKAITSMNDKSFYSDNCLNRARNLYNKDDRYEDYCNAYKFH